MQVMDTIVDADEGRMIRLLLVNTTLYISINDTTGTPFTTITGTPQGDSLSPLLFVCYLEAALRDVRAHLQPAPQTDMIIQTDTEYADDVTFISTSHYHLQYNSHYHRSKPSLKPRTCASMKPKQCGWK